MKKILYTALLILLPFTALAAETYTEPTTGMEFVFIKGGSFVMGDITGRDTFASPAHQVTVGDFWFGKYEVTFAQYDAFCEATKREKPDDAGWGRDQRPVINVNWDDAVAFTEWLSKKSGRSMRLPSESEWEYAARGGRGSKYPWGNQIGIALANCRECGTRWDKKMSAPVGSFPANAFGLHDMIGNVYEWCLDTRHENYQGAPTDGSAWLGKHKDRVNRGGSWYQSAFESTVHRRCWDDGSAKTSEFGFRVLMQP